MQCAFNFHQIQLSGTFAILCEIYAEVIQSGYKWRIAFLARELVMSRVAEYELNMDAHVATKKHLD